MPKSRIHFIAMKTWTPRLSGQSLSGSKAYVRMLGLGHRTMCPNGHNNSAQLFTMVSFNSIIVALGGGHSSGKRLGVGLPCRARITWAGVANFTEYCKGRGYHGQYLTGF